MTEDAISTLYRKACPSCARHYARDSRACPFCGYVEALTSETEEDQERLYGEYLAARYKQAHDETERLRRAVALHPGDRTQSHALALALADKEALGRELAAYREGHHQAPRKESPHVATADKEAVAHEPAADRGGHRKAAHKEPPLVATADKECPVCTATLPKAVERCACGYVFGAGVVAMTITCPHCTAVLTAGAERCGCGYVLPPSAPVSGIPGLRRR